MADLLKCSQVFMLHVEDLKEAEQHFGLDLRQTLVDVLKAYVELEVQYRGHETFGSCHSINLPERNALKILFTIGGHTFPVDDMISTQEIIDSASKFIERHFRFRNAVKKIEIMEKGEDFVNLDLKFYISLRLNEFEN